MQLKALFSNPACEANPASADEASYADWREASDGVTQAYRSWTAAPRDQHWLAHAAYRAALECEEHAARAYQRHAERLRGAVVGTVS